MVDDGIVTAFRDGVVTLRSNRREDGFTMADKEIGYQGVEPRDLVIHAMDGFAGAIGVSDSRGKCSPVYTIAVPRKGRLQSHTLFWAYYLRNLATSGFIQSLAKGIRERSTDFRWNDASNLLVNFPDFETQKAIADFLDRETVRIDQLIEKKQLLVELLAERRATRIAALLTNGLNTEVKFTDTGIPWIGAIPAHWSLIKLRYLVKIRTGGRDTENRVDDGEYPFFVRSDTVERINTYAIDDEAVLTSGDGAGVGKVFHHYEGKFDFHQRVYAFTDFKKVTARFFYYFLSSFFQYQMTQHSAKSTVDSVRMPFLQGMRFVVPPIEEQDEITRLLDRDVKTSITLVNGVRDSIERTRELRSALITSAVTGQIDVATWGKRGTTDRQLDAIEADMAATAQPQRHEAARA